MEFSPEIGFGFGGGVVGYALLRMLRREFGWLAIVPVPFAGFGLFLLLAGKGYLHVLSLFSGGAYSLIVEPQLFVLMYLTSLIWLAPAGLAAWRREDRPDADLLLGMFVLGLALVPAAFGRADLGHVVYNGLAILLLGLIAVSAWRPPARLAWALVIFAVVLTGQRIDFMLYRQQLQYVVASQIVERVPLETRCRLAATPLFQHTNTAKLLQQESLSSPFDVDRVQSIVGSSKVEVPLEVPLEVEEALRQRDLYQPGFYLFEAGLFDRKLRGEEGLGDERIDVGPSTTGGGERGRDYPEQRIHSRDRVSLQSASGAVCHRPTFHVEPAAELAPSGHR